MIKCFFEKTTNTCQYVVACSKTKKCALIDTVWDYEQRSGRFSTGSADEILSFVKEQQYSVEWILETHAHADHVSASQYLKEKTGAKIGIGEHIRDVQEVFKPVFNMKEMRTDGSQFDHLFKDGEKFRIGEMEVEIMHTPGHTPACICYYFADGGFIFVGDTIFMPDQGTARCDFPKGDAATLYKSIQRVLSLPRETKIYCCHDYGPGGRDFAWETTVAAQQDANIHAKKEHTEEHFINFRTERDSTLAHPMLLLPSVQVNILAGRLPEPEDNGTSYLKIPVNRL